MESLKDIKAEEIDLSRMIITFVMATGEEIEILTTKEHGRAIVETLEKVCIHESEWYQNLDKRIDELEIKLDALEGNVTDDLSFRIAI
jgi:hypothetical protein